MRRDDLMIATAEAIDLSNFNLTEEKVCFRDANFGGLYIPPQEDFSEIDQQTLSTLIQTNHFNPIPGYDEKNLEFFPDDFFLETPYDDLSEAEAHIKFVFEHFKIIDSSYCESIISKLRTFMSVFPSNKKLHGRFEILSGDSCKKFHVDRVGARLIYTCAGPGTQVKTPHGESFITLPTGSAIIAKGTDYPGFKLTTLHRSPPIQYNSTKRFLFIADYQ